MYVFFMSVNNIFTKNLATIINFKGGFGQKMLRYKLNYLIYPTFPTSNLQQWFQNMSTLFILILKFVSHLKDIFKHTKVIY